jgi:phosphatidylglycerol:prolipoprotein diacylglycerol transferase
MAQSILNMVTNYWFWVMAGFLLGGSLCVRNMMKNGCSFPLAVVAVTIGLYGGLLGTRVIYVLIFYPRLFLDNPIAAIAFWQGTGTWLAGPFFGSIGVLIVLKAARKPFWSNLGSMAPGLALGHAVSRMGCVFAGCCYGAPTLLPWGVYSEKLNGMVHPTPIYSMIGELISMGVLQVLWRKPKYRPYLPPLYGMILATHRFISEYFRGAGPGPEIISGLRIYQTLCVFIFAFSLCVFVILKWKKAGVISAVCITFFIGALTICLKPEKPPRFGAIAGQTGLYLVITRSLFTESLDQWIAMRRDDGFDVLIHPWEQAPSTREIRDWIKQQTDKRDVACHYILIIGDCGANGEERANWHIPSVRQLSQNNQQIPEFITDTVYGDLDHDGCPDIPVGRLAVRSTSQLKEQIRKILNYQNQKISPQWLRAIIWTGAKGYSSQIGLIADSLPERLPKWVTPFIINGDPDSSYSGHLPDQPKIFLNQISKAPFLSVVASHGSFRSITPASYRQKNIFLAVEDVISMTSHNPSGAMFLLGCDSGKFNTAQSLGLSLSEAFAEHPGGPIGVIAATAETNPLTNYFFAIAMIEQFDQQNLTIGDLMFGIQQKLYMQGKTTLAEIAQGDRFATKLMKAVPDREQQYLFVSEKLRREALMYNLLGDPACEMKLPNDMTLQVVSMEKDKLIVLGETPTEVSELFCELRRVPKESTFMGPQLSIKERRARFNEVNQQTRTLIKKPVSGKKWKIQVPLTYEITREKNCLRCMAIGPESIYVGWLNIVQREPEVSEGLN